MSQGPFLRKYGVQTTFNFDLFEVDGVDFRTDAAHASGDTKIMKDEGAEANTTNAFTDEGQGYSIVLTATEMQAARVKVYIVDSATKVWLDTALVIETYGNASAQHAFDLDTASTAQTGDNFARLGAPAGASIAADLVVIDDFVDGIESDLANGTDGLGALKTLIDTVNTDLSNGTDGLGALKTLIDGLNDITVANVLTTQMTEAYAADGTAPTLAQILHLILAMVSEFAISGTTLTAKKLDGSTTAATFTLSDATDPTSITRAS